MAHATVFARPNHCALMSCCGFPPRSNEPEYPLHPALAALLQRWEQEHPGIFEAVRGEIGRGDWDALGADGLHVPAYSLSKAFEVAVDQLGKVLLANERARQIKKGSFLVRWGLSKPMEMLSAPLLALVDDRRAEAQAVCASAELPAPMQDRPYPLLYV